MAMRGSKAKPNGNAFHVLLLLSAGCLGYHEITMVKTRWDKMFWEAMTSLKEKPSQPQGAAELCRRW